MKNFDLMKVFLFSSCILFCVFSCKDHEIYVEPSVEKMITSFSFLQENNPDLSQDYEGKVSNGDYRYIEVVLPDGTDLTALVPSVEFEGGHLQPSLEDRSGNQRSFDFSLGLVTFAIVNDESNSDVESKQSVIYNVDVYTSSTGSNLPDSIANPITPTDTTDTISVEQSDVAVDNPISLAYFPSWSENEPSAGGNSRLRETPTYVTTLLLSFAKPDLRYKKGSYQSLKHKDFVASTGIEVPYNAATLKESIRILKDKGIDVLLSLGGEAYWHDALINKEAAQCYKIDYQQIKDFVDDMGFMGIDWDYEPGGQISVLSEEFHVNKYIEFVNKTREVMPEGKYLLACAPSGVGALGGIGTLGITGNGIDDPNSPYNNAYGQTLGNIHGSGGKTGASPATLFGFTSSGHFIPVMKAVGRKLDIVIYQGYNVGGSTDRKVMYDAYSYYANIYGFDVVAGVHVANEPWGPYYLFDNNIIANLAAYIYNGGRENRAGSNDGIMIWELLAIDRSVRGNSGFEFMKITYDVLRGVDKTTALAAAGSASVEPHGNSTTNDDDVFVEEKPTQKHCEDDKYVWSADKTYAEEGHIVSYNGKLWRNSWWSKGNEPGTGGPWDVWKVVYSCSE